jgi:hypothetical protein
LKAGYVDIYNLNDRSQYYNLKYFSKIKNIIPLNSIISPLFTNIYFHQIDVQLERLRESFFQNRNISKSKFKSFCVFFERKHYKVKELEKEIFNRYNKEFNFSFWQERINLTALRGSFIQVLNNSLPPRMY